MLQMHTYILKNIFEYILLLFIFRLSYNDGQDLWNKICKHLLFWWGYSNKVATDHSLQKYRRKNLFFEFLAHVKLLFLHWNSLYSYWSQQSWTSNYFNVLYKKV